MTDAWFLPATAWQPPADLLTFLDAGPAPVYTGFGSMSGQHTAAHDVGTYGVAADGAARGGGDRRWGRSGPPTHPTTCTYLTQPRVRDCSPACARSCIMVEPGPPLPPRGPVRRRSSVPSSATRSFGAAARGAGPAPSADEAEAADSGAPRRSRTPRPNRRADGAARSKAWGTSAGGGWSRARRTADRCTAPAWITGTVCRTTMKYTLPNR
jgi:hypothetical protein